MSFLLCEPAVDDAGVANGVFDYRHFLHLRAIAVVEHDRQVVADVGGSKGIELASALTRKNKTHGWLAIFVGRRFGSTEIATADRGSARNDVPGWATFGVTRADALALHQNSIRRQHTTVFL